MANVQKKNNPTKLMVRLFSIIDYGTIYSLFFKKLGEKAGYAIVFPSTEQSWY